MTVIVKRTLIIMPIMLVLSCSEPQHTVHFKPVMNGDKLAFHFEYENVNGLTAITVWEKDTRKTLWYIDLPYYYDKVVEYGNAPSEFKSRNNNTQYSDQHFPKDNAPPIAIPKDKVIMVRYGFQYDKFMAASGSTLCYAFKITEGGALEDYGPQPGPIPGVEDADIYEIMRKEYEMKQKQEAEK